MDSESDKTSVCHEPNVNHRQYPFTQTVWQSMSKLSMREFSRTPIKRAVWPLNPNPFESGGLDDRLMHQPAEHCATGSLPYAGWSSSE
jgi:hypothetical protein